MFPSWDEPDYKATFDLTARVPADQMAVSNMPAASSRPIAGGLKEVRFQTTPTMSSYLLFFGAGEFGRITEDGAARREIGIVMGRGNDVQGAYRARCRGADLALSTTNISACPIPLPKLDNVAGSGPVQFFSAMENWGAIFTFERVLLDDPAMTTERERQAIFGVDAHEMAHQWFGDLVTMAWWDDLWLNEGFACWMATKATAHFHPEWGAEFGAVGAREGAMGQDSLRHHPPDRPARAHGRAGQPGLRRDHLFQGRSRDLDARGICRSRVVAARHPGLYPRPRLRNTRTDDLWRAVEAAGAKGLTQIAHDFTLQPGVPLIRVGAVTCSTGQTQVTLIQDEFSEDRKPGSFTPLRWHVPLRVGVVGGQPITTVTAGRETQVTVPGCGPLLVNDGQTGYYRSLYTAAAAEQLRANFAQIDPVDEFGLVLDQLALSRAGYQPMGIGLDFAAAIPTNASPELQSLGVGTWSGMYRLFDGDVGARRQIAALVEQRYAPVLAQIGMAPVPGEKPTVTTLRPQLIQALGLVGDPQVNAEAQRMFAALQSNPNAAPGGLKQTWLGIVAVNANATTWEQLHAMARNASSATERQNLYSLLGQAKDEALAKRALELALTDEPGKTVSAGMIGAVAGQHPDLALDFVLTHWSEVQKFVDLSAQSRFIGRLASGSHNEATVAKLNAYAKANIAESDRKPIDQAINVIRVRLATEPRTKSEASHGLARMRPQRLSPGKHAGAVTGGTRLITLANPL